MQKHDGQIYCGQRASWRGRGERAFTMVDVMASLAVIMVLIALLLPSLSTIRETARRVVCGSNVRQIGLGLAMYADDYDRFLPPSRFGGNPAAPQETIRVRLLQPAVATGQSVWDGLGILYKSDYLTAPGVFYCPSHHGSHSFPLYSGLWPTEGTALTCNYQLRVDRGKDLYRMDPSVALVTDALRTQQDFSHVIGCNFVRADLSATWYTDSMRTLINSLPVNEADLQAAAKVSTAWSVLDGIGADGENR